MPVKLYVLKSHHWREKISGNLSLQPQWWKISNQIKLALEFHIFNYFSHFNKMISLHWINLLSLNMLQSSKKCKKLHPKEHLISNYINIFTNFSDLALNADVCQKDSQRFIGEGETEPQYPNGRTNLYIIISRGVVYFYFTFTEQFSTQAYTISSSPSSTFCKEVQTRPGGVVHSHDWSTKTSVWTLKSYP